MTPDPATGELERRVGVVLGAGTWAASAVIAVGWAWSVFDASAGQAVVMSGVAIVIALPVLRVAMMLCAFANARDYRFVAVAVVVLLLIGLGGLAGLNAATRP